MQLSKKNIISSAVFLLGLVALLALSSMFFQPKNNMEQYGMEEPRANGILSEPEETLDVLFVGDSISYASIMPIQIWRDYGITSYLCGSTMQDLYLTKEFVNKAFEKQSPEIVFLGTAAIFNEFTEQEKLWNSLEQMMPVLRYHDRWKKISVWPEWETGFEVDYAYQEPGKGYYYSLGVEYIDLNYMQEEVPIDWMTDTFDYGDHLNYYGAQKVSAYLGKYLAETGLFEDKRENPDYDFWKEAQAAFYEGKPQ